MPKRTSIKELYSEIRKYLFYMIPEKWNKIYLYASIIQRENGEETGEMFFYYFPQSILKKNPVNVYQVPAKFNLDEEEYIKLTYELYELLKQLRHECISCDKINWSNITISIENVEGFFLHFAIYSAQSKRTEEVKARAGRLAQAHDS